MWKKEFLVNAWVDTFFVSHYKAIVIWPKDSIRKNYFIAHIFPKTIEKL